MSCADDLKRALRQELSRRKKGVPQDELVERSAVAQRLLVARPEWGYAGTVALYAHLGSEVETRHLLEVALSHGKTACFPKVEPGSRILSFAAARSEEELEPGGTLGIAEPTGEAVPLERIDLFVIPGLAFDEQGERLGRGGGYYDATLAAAREDAIRVGLCFDFQIVEQVPVAPNDLHVDLVVTDTRVIEPLRGRIPLKR